MNSILLHKGGNDYTFPHIGKGKIGNEIGRDLPFRLPCRAVIAGDNIDGNVINAFVVAANDGTYVDCCVVLLLSFF